MSSASIQSRPILLMGSGRSGTTFLAKIIDSHPDVLYRHEPDRVRVNTAIPFLPPDDLPEPLLNDAAEYLDVLLNVGNGTTSGHTPFFDKAYRSSLGGKAHRTGALVAKLIDKLPAGPGIAVPEFLLARPPRPIRYLIKSVSSMWRTRLFALARPEFQIIHLVRHPCAVVASRLRGIEQGRMQRYIFLQAVFEANRGQRFGMSLEELQGKSVEEQIAFEWMAVNQQVYDDMQILPSYHLVVYEDLCSQLVDETQRLFDFLGLAYSEQTAEFITALQGMGTNRRYFSVRQSPTSALYKWRDELTASQISTIANMVGNCEIGSRMLSADVAT